MALAYSPRSGGTRGAACAKWIIPDLLPLPSTQALSLERRSRLRISAKVRYRSNPRTGARACSSGERRLMADWASYIAPSS